MKYNLYVNLQGKLNTKNRISGIAPVSIVEIRYGYQPWRKRVWIMYRLSL
ncbi:hypothetical protein [Clostridium thermosuccinogenes]|nr:hypothetical protein [Pseudoclostridium thermosuccinogenes]